MKHSRREFLAATGSIVAGAAMPWLPVTRADEAQQKRHIVTLSFDDGFRKSFRRIAEIYEKYQLSACLNVIATGHEEDFQPPGEYIAGSPRGDFGLWNELKQRGHEIMPHTYRHTNLRQVPFDEAIDLIARCLDVFTERLKGFDPKKAVYNFAYNASTPELEKWLAGRVRAFRTGGDAINRWPHPGQVKLTCTSFGPGNCEQAIDQEIERLLARQKGWFIFNTHGLDEEGWGPIRATYLDRLLDRLTGMDSVDVLPAGRALAKYVDAQLEDVSLPKTTERSG
ncbi:MAG: polysaccharide deacetylase family protein [Phycisphaerales bacterium]|nr:MAG: polysaccharide deacetylase family protein [Phycisphaerales bacterium]